jgi:hypothetical protein
MAKSFFPLVAHRQGGYCQAIKGGNIHTVVVADGLNATDALDEVVEADNAPESPLTHFDNVERTDNMRICRLEMKRGRGNRLGIFEREE